VHQTRKTSPLKGGVFWV